MNEITSDPLDDDELAYLDEFLLDRLDDEAIDRIAAVDGDEGILDMSELDGFLTALVSAPSTLTPSRWLPVVWGAEAPAWESPDHFEEMFELITRHQNSIGETLRQAPDRFEPMFTEQEVEGSTHLIVDEWCHGYMRGVALDAQAWNEPEVAALLRPIRLWGTAEGQDLLDAMSEADQAREHDAIPNSVRALYEYWRKRRTPAGPQRSFN